MIGVSAGAVEALSAILPTLPGDFALPIMIVVHLPADRKSAIQDLFRAKCPMTIKEAEDKEPIAGATVYPEIVFLDIGLPGMNGREVARALRADERTRRSVLVAITGYGSEEDRRRSAEAGFNYHLTKPVEGCQLNKLFSEIDIGSIMVVCS